MDRSRIDPWTRELISDTDFGLSGLGATIAPEGYLATTANGDIIVDTPNGALLVGREATTDSLAKNSATAAAAAARS